MFKCFSLWIRRICSAHDSVPLADPTGHRPVQIHLRFGWWRADHNWVTRESQQSNSPCNLLQCLVVFKQRFWGQCEHTTFYLLFSRSDRVSAGLSRWCYSREIQHWDYSSITATLKKLSPAPFFILNLQRMLPHSLSCWPVQSFVFCVF